MWLCVVGGVGVVDNLDKFIEGDMVIIHYSIFRKYNNFDHLIYLSNSQMIL